MNFEEHACCFPCHGDLLYGVLSMPEQIQASGVLMLVGGPQYRAGSHRQFTLLARALAADGIPAMRFDYRGMGDSEGESRDFEQVGEDIRCAVDHFMQSVPGMREVVIWGLCDAATAALLYARHDNRVSGLVLINPWARTESGLAKTTLRHYYLSRFFEASLWRKILRGRLDYGAAGRSLLQLLRITCRKKPDVHDRACSVPASLPDRMFDGYSGFRGKVLLILSGNDLTAREFSDLAAGSRRWRTLMQDQRTQRHELPGANHTFSTRAWRDEVSSRTRQWIRQQQPVPAVCDGA
jgi:exosortase A-associated hydrolase 1